MGSAARRSGFVIPPPRISSTPTAARASAMRMGRVVAWLLWRVMTRAPSNNANTTATPKALFMNLEVALSVAPFASTSSRERRARASQRR